MSVLREIDEKGMAPNGRDHADCLAASLSALGLDVGYELPAIEATSRTSSSPVLLVATLGALWFFGWPVQERNRQPIRRGGLTLVPFSRVLGTLIHETAMWDCHSKTAGDRWCSHEVVASNERFLASGSNPIARKRCRNKNSINIKKYP